MMYLLKHKPLAVLLGGLLVFSSCRKDSDSNSGAAPVIEPLTVAASKPNDTLTIKGQNFDATSSGNVVKFGGVEAVVVSASETEIKVLIPAVGTSGVSYTITVTAHGKTTEVGSIVITPLTFYVIKGVFSNVVAEHQVITINPNTGEETLIANAGPDRINDIVYFSGTNEIMGVDDDGKKLTKINVTTKQVTTSTLSTNANIKIEQLVVDNSGNLYAVKFEKAAGDHYLQTLVKLDPATAKTTDIKTFEHGYDWEELVYVPASNDVVGLTDDGTSLIRVNLTTKETATVSLPGSANAYYRELIVDDKSNLYAYKAAYPGDGSDIAQIVKVNAVTGQETLFKSLPVDGKFNDKLIFVPQFNEFMGTWEQQVVFRLNATSLNYVFSPTPTVKGNTYNYITTN